MTHDLLRLAGPGARELPQPDRTRWRLLRAGLQNLWEYDDQRFVFHRGRLLLRGRNEAGKSKALELLLPFLLDADLNPRRLDPFGSESRQMKWNLLNGGDADQETRVGYAWVELGRQGSEGAEFVTLGAGLKARRSARDVEAWYFVTTARVDGDLALLDAGRTPLSRSRLEEALAGSGRVFDRKAEYRREVNQRLFGLGEAQYAALIDTLLQLRRPQLAKQLDPEHLSGILSKSLPPLDAGVVAQLAEGFERLDRHRNERAEWQRTHHAVRDFLKTYRHYVLLVGAGRAQALTRADSQYQKARAEQREQEEARGRVATELEGVERGLEGLAQEAQALDARRDTLLGSDAYRAVQALDAAEQRARESDGRAVEADADRASTESRREGASAAHAGAVQEADARRHAARGGAEEAASAARAAALTEAHAPVATLVDAGDPDSARTVRRELLAARRTDLSQLRGLQQALQKAEGTLEAAGARLSDAQGRHRDAEERLQQAKRAELEAERAFERDVSAWLEGLQELDLTDAEVEALQATPAERRAAWTREAAKPRHARLDAALAEVAVRLEQQRGRLARLTEDRRALLAAPHPAPDVPAWRSADRTGRPGAPFYLLCDFRDEVVAGVRERVEAALEAAGLLDAWVTPDGRLLDPDTHDLLLTPVRPVPGDSLLGVLRPTPTEAVGTQAVEAVLAGIAWGEEPVLGKTEAPAAWIAADGSFGLGPLRGRASKAQVEYVGATARAEARRRRLAELDAAIADVEAAQAQTEGLRFQLQQRRADLEAEVDAFPGTTALVRCRAQVHAQAVAVEDAAARVEQAREKVVAAREARNAALEARDRRAANAGLAAWCESLDVLGELTDAYQTASDDLLHAAAELRRARSRVDECRADLARAEEAHAKALDTARSRKEEAVRARAEADALRDQIGADGEAVLVQVRDTETRREAVRRQQAQDAGRRDRLVREQAAAETRLESAVEKVEAQERTRREAQEAFTRLASTGLLAEAELELPGTPADWTLTDALGAARQVQSSVATSGPDAEDTAMNRVMDRLSEAVRAVTTGVQLRPRHEDGLLLFDASLQGRPQTLVGLRDALAADVAERDRLLDQEERDLFESFLTGETHEHLRDRLRTAHRLKQDIDAQLQKVPTPHGTVLRLLWKPKEGGPEGAAQALELLLRSPHLLTEADRQALRAFLQQQLEAARADEAAGSLEDRMMAALDYRAWYQFEIEFREADGRWKKLTRRAHAAGSGGQKAVTLHLPLFAAAAAFFASAREDAPRLILLDEAFAGIDRKMRGSLMGLLAAFDLDFVMTSFEEWGFYAELDGLATYHLTREPGMPGVYCERYLWDGRTAHEQGAA